MWIRSQNREVLVKVTSVNVYQNAINGSNESCTGDDNYFRLGVYSTKERAIEVLDDIEDSLFFGRIAYKMPEE